MENDPFKQLLSDIAEAPFAIAAAAARSTLPPLAAEIDGLRAQLRGIVQAYDLALHDPRAMIPTPLQMVIEAARKTHVVWDAEAEREHHKAAVEEGDRERMDAVKASFPQRQGFSE